jgi:hypothetical protein
MRAVMRFCVLILTVCMVVVLPASVYAQGTVMVLGVHGDEPNALERGRLHREMAEAVGYSGAYLLADQSDMPLDEVALVMGCAAPTPGCLESFAEFTGVEFLLYGVVVRADTGQSTLQAILFQASTRSEYFRTEIPLQMARGPQYVPTRLAGALAGVPVVEISSPQAAYIVVDGLQRGAAPVLLMDLQPGTHEVIARYGDGTMDRGQIVVPDTGFVSVEVNQAVATLRRGDAARRAPVARRVIGWSLLAVAAGAATAGGLLASDANRIETQLAGAATQREAYDLAERGRSLTRGANVAFVASGVLLATAIPLVVIQPRDSRVAVRVTSGGLAVTF